MDTLVETRWSKVAVTIAMATLSVSTVISVYFLRKKSREFSAGIRGLETSLATSIEKCTAERKGRIRAQQALRKAVAEPKSDNVELTSYPMTPIGIVRSAFSTRNGTPRQPSLVPLARAQLMFNSALVPLASLEGLGDYSHCWIIYVFHLNTDIEKLWKRPSNSKFKAKVRVPRLNGGRVGVFATRSPHRPCPIGLTVAKDCARGGCRYMNAKVESVQGHKVLLSGVDLVDGTPILDVKPYLPYSDSILGATVPSWLMGDNLLTVAAVFFSKGFESTLAKCWALVEKKSFYESAEEFKTFIEQVLSWDIRSQRNRHSDLLCKTGHEAKGENSDLEERIYHVVVEGLNVSYKINGAGEVLVENVQLHFPENEAINGKELTASEESDLA